MKKLKKILLVDDSVSTNKRNKSIIEELGVADEIIMFSDGQESIEYLKKCKMEKTFPELLILDITMPKMDGFEFLNSYINLHTDDKSDFDTVIVILSDYLDFKNFEKAKMYKPFGVLEHLRKPMDPSDVLTLIEDNF